MRLRACIALLLYVSACATSAPSPREPAARDPRLANLQRAATLPWTDGGRCAVREASEPWPVLAERCFHALDHDRIEFHDTTELATRTLWEVKTDNFDTYTDDLQVIVVKSQVPKLRHERALALACGFDFHVGVRSEVHKEALEEEAPDLIGLIVVMGWC
ncbi:DUF6310 domain-containing protein [Archangium lansingense]|uniref:DUF6310 domain-containing protein n=1 Tax=Archangium lansingense TaxID=2995310 RepID=UPI003B7BE041